MSYTRRSQTKPSQLKTCVKNVSKLNADISVKCINVECSLFQIYCANST